MTNRANFVYSISKKNGYKSKMEGVLRSPEQHGVVTAALCGSFSDNCDLLIAAPDLLEAANMVISLFAYQGDDATGYADHVEAKLKAAIAKAEGR